jgi:hypothetical protein
MLRSLFNEKRPKFKYSINKKSILKNIKKSPFFVVLKDDGTFWMCITHPKSTHCVIELKVLDNKG